MAVLKKIKFGESTNNIAKTVVNGAPNGVISVTNTAEHTNLDSEDKDYSYDIDVNVDNATIVKDNGALKVDTVPAAQVSVADSDGVFTAENVETALKELKDDIAEVGGKAKSYEIIKETSETEGATLESNVLEQYKLQQTVNGKTSIAGETIKIYKDKNLKEVKLNGQKLDFTYILADGTEKTVSVDISDFLAESEFKNGLQVNSDGEVSVKVDSTSENFLTVGADGVKLAGVQDAINAAVDALDVTDTAKDGEYVSAVNETNGKVSMTRANVSDAVLNGYEKGSDATAIAATDSLKAALSKLENQVDKAKAAATTKVKKNSNASHLIVLQSDPAADGSVTYTIGESDIASKAALDAEITARKAVDGQDGQTYAANSSANYIKDATSLNDADVKLDAAIKAVSDKTDAIQYKVTGTTLEFFGIELKS